MQLPAGAWDRGQTGANPLHFTEEVRFDTVVSSELKYMDFPNACTSNLRQPAKVWDLW